MDTRHYYRPKTKDSSQLISILQGLSLDITELDLSWFWLAKSYELTGIIAAIPTRIKALKLGGNFEYDLDTAGFVNVLQILSMRCHDLEHLDLSESELGRRTEAELQLIMGALSRTLRSLNLRSNHLGWKKKRLVNILRELPPNLDSLDIGDNDLFWLSPKNFKSLMAILPQSLRHLMLEINFWIQDDEKFLNYLMAFPRQLESVDWNCDDVDVHHAIFPALKNALPPSLQTLYMFNPSRSRLDMVHLKNFFRSLPPSVTTVKMPMHWFQSSHWLDDRDIVIVHARINAVIGAISLPITHFEITSSGYLPFVRDEHIKSIMQTCPPCLTSLSLRYPHPYELREYIKYLSPHLRSLTINDQLFDVSVVLAEHLPARVNSLLMSTPNKIPNFESVTLGIDIDEDLLVKNVHALEKTNTPLSLLTAGLLLEGYIPSSYQYTTDSSYAGHMEVRMHNAISFYSRASTDPQLRPLISYLLWEMQTVSSFESVRRRLSSWDLQPPATFVGTYERFRQRPGNITIPASFFHYSPPISQPKAADSTPRPNCSGRY